MVDRMDWNIGRVVEYLKKSDQYDNTLNMFMSDNGAAGATYEAAPLIGDKIMAHVHKYYDNSLENVGRGNSFVWYGCRWAQAATAPSRLYKMYSTEGGCRVPLIAKPPHGVTGNLPLPDGIITDAFCTVMDIVPTVLEMAELSHPVQYKGKDVAQLRGRSWVPFLSQVSSAPTSDVDQVHQIHGPDYTVGFETAGSGALRKGDWKITFVPAPNGPQKWELFNIREDPGEVHDLATEKPELMKEMLELWKEYKTDVGSIGVAGEFESSVQGAGTMLDEMDDPYAWIKYIGRPEITPERLKPVVPQIA
jgi:arylsulfatase